MHTIKEVMGTWEQTTLVVLGKKKEATEAFRLIKPVAFLYKILGMRIEFSILWFSDNLNMHELVVGQLQIFPVPVS